MNQNKSSVQEREVRRIFSLLDSQDIGYLGIPSLPSFLILMYHFNNCTFVLHVDHNTFANYLNSFNATKRKDTQRLWCALDIFQVCKKNISNVCSFKLIYKFDIGGGYYFRVRQGKYSWTLFWPCASRSCITAPCRLRGKTWNRPSNG